MAELNGVLSERLGLVDAVDHLLERGVVLVGQTTLSLANVDLVYIGLNLLVASVETLRQTEGQRPAGPTAGGPQSGTLPGMAGPRAAPGGPLPGSAAGLAHSPPLAVDSGTPMAAPGGVPPEHERAGGPASVSLAGLPERFAATDERPEQGLARLVLTLVELLRQVLERQAIRRMEGGGLAEADVERMGLALLELESKMAELRAIFDLGEADLNLDLGPLRELLQ